MRGEHAARRLAELEAHLDGPDHALLGLEATASPLEVRTAYVELMWELVELMRTPPLSQRALRIYRRLRAIG